MNLDSSILTPIFFAFISGVIPTLIWLYFWTREDRENPEPKSMIALAFIGGMIAVFISLFLEKYLFGLGLKNLITSSFLSNTLPWFEQIAQTYKLSHPLTANPLANVLLVVVFAPFIEEISKFIMAYILVLRSKDDDEPLDPMIYMITTALGFAAVENMLFLINPFVDHNFILTIFTGNMRFVGATLLHTISSASVAIFISFHFFDSKMKKFFFTIFGIMFAIIIHGTFNFLMIGDQSASTLALELIWITVIIILLAFEKIKKIRLEKIN